MRKILLVLLILVCVGCCACGADSDTKRDKKEEKVIHDENETVVLNDRQKEILEAEELPTDYDSLTNNQKSAIAAIDDLLSYMEEKYNKEFEYNGYIPDGYDGECLTVTLKNDPFERIINVYREDDGEDGWIYSDDFEEKLFEDDYQELLAAHIRETLPNNKYFLDTEVFGLDDEQDVAFKKADADSAIFIENTFKNSSEAKSYVEEFMEWMCKDGVGRPFGVTFYFQSIEDLMDTNYFSYSDQIWNNKYEYMYDASVSMAGDISISGE